ncbi:MAG: DNA repair protein RadA [Bradymonadales bacterium]|nr:MAG: DNA repair protein RadA [Bradymonadales bacterium]
MPRAAALEFQCQSCETEFPKWFGKCPECGEWNSLLRREEKKKALKPNSRARHWMELKAPSLTEHQSFELAFIQRLLGGGLPRGSVVLLAGQPGVGKSTLLFQTFASSSQKVLFASTEESESQLAVRFRKFCRDESAPFFVMSTSLLEDILQEADRLEVDTVVVDSIQMLGSRSSLQSRWGAGLMRELSDELVSQAKAKSRSLWIVGHVNKEGEIAGPKTLEHLVDCVFLFCGSDDPSVRSLQVQKNRFGPSGELALLRMEEKGLTEIPNPESFWMHQYSKSVPGCVYCPILLGSRVYCVEVQALCAATAFPSPRRTVSGFDLQRLHLILALLEKRLDLRFSGLDVYLNIVGGLKVEDTAADLAVAAALISAIKNQAFPSERVFLGELGLTGEIRSVPGVKQRLEAAARVGKQSAVFPASAESEKISELELLPHRHIQDLF